MQEISRKIFSFRRLRKLYRRFRLLFVLAIIACAGGGLLFIPYGSKPEYSVRELLLCRYDVSGSYDAIQPVDAEKVVEQLNKLISADDFGRQLRSKLAVADAVLPDSKINISVTSGAIPGVVEITCQHFDSLLIFEMLDALVGLWEERRLNAPVHSPLPILNCWVQEEPMLSKSDIFAAVIVRSFSGACAGVIFAFLAAALITLTDKEEINIRNLEKKSGMPVFGLLPDVAAELDGTAENGFSRLYFDAISSLRSNLGIISADPFPGKILQVAGLENSSGQGTAVSSLAMAVTYLNKRVLLIEADVRRRQRNWVIKLPENQEGLSEVLTGRRKVEEVILRNINGLPLDVLPKGKWDGAPGTLFRSRDCEELLRQLSAEYDYILIDSSAFLDFNDSMILGRLADATLLLCDYRRCSSEKLHLAMWRMERVGVNIAGVAIEHFPLNKRYRHYYNYQTSFYQYSGR